MESIRRFCRDLSLRKSFVGYVLFFAGAALALCILTGVLCDHMIQKIQDGYPYTTEQIYLTNEQGEQRGEGTTIIHPDVPISGQDRQLIALLEFLPGFLTPFYFLLCLLSSAFLFYRNKLKQPLELLREASERISENDLDFSIVYDSQDELGALCSAFELMRGTLSDNFLNMWRQAEARKQLNAAFAHDLRTPLTVLKGYQEILQSGSDPQTRETARIMGKHIERLERYADSMNRLQHLEDTQPNYARISVSELLEALAGCADILCQKQQITWKLEQEIVSKQMLLDASLILQAGDNLLSNGVRYARSQVTLCLKETEEGLLLIVSDDGSGFSEQSLREAVKPYYTEAPDHSEHFGLGLYICQILCSHHGGYLKMENQTVGAKLTAFFRSPKEL